MFGDCEWVEAEAVFDDEDTFNGRLEHLAVICVMQKASELCAKDYPYAFFSTGRCNISRVSHMTGCTPSPRDLGAHQHMGVMGKNVEKCKTTTLRTWRVAAARPRTPAIKE